MNYMLRDMNINDGSRLHVAETLIARDPSGGYQAPSDDIEIFEGMLGDVNLQPSIHSTISRDVGVLIDPQRPSSVIEHGRYPAREWKTR